MKPLVSQQPDGRWLVAFGVRVYGRFRTRERALWRASQVAASSRPAKEKS